MIDWVVSDCECDTDLLSYCYSVTDSVGLTLTEWVSQLNEWTMGMV